MKRLPGLDDALRVVRVNPVAKKAWDAHLAAGCSTEQCLIAVVAALATHTERLLRETRGPCLFCGPAR